MDISDTTLYQLIGERLKRQRLALGKTQGDIADELGMLRTSITNIEAGRQKPPLHILYQLCVVLNLEPHQLFPLLEEVTTTTTLRVGVDGDMQEVVVPPKTAEFLKELLQDE